MKCCVVICDGMADEPAEESGGHTPLEAAHTPAMDRLATLGRCGCVATIPHGHYPGSENGILTILGYPPAVLPTGRAWLEALGLGLIHHSPEATAARYRLTSPDIPVGHFIDLYPHIAFHPLSATAGLAISPNGNYPADDPAISFWSVSPPHPLPPFPIGSAVRKKTAIVGATPLLKGIAMAAGMTFIQPAGATGGLDTDYAAKGQAAIDALHGHDIVIVHIEACDTASHLLDLEAKRQAIEAIDRHIVAPLLEHAARPGVGFAMALLPDHPASWTTGEHASRPVPAIIFNPSETPDPVTAYTEESVVRGHLTDLTPLYRLYAQP